MRTTLSKTEIDLVRRFLAELYVLSAESRSVVLSVLVRAATDPDSNAELQNNQILSRLTDNSDPQ